MKVLVFGPYALNTPHFETELEIMQNHLDQGDDAVFLGCNSELMACDANPYHDYKRCLECIGKRTVGIPLLSSRIKVRSFFNLSSKNKEELNSLKVDFSGIDELKSYRIEQFDLGWAVLSSIVTITRDPEPDLQKTAGLLKNLLVSSFAVYRSMQNHIEELKIDRAYIFNGRLAIMRAAVRACESKNVEFVTHERVFNIHHYGMYKNTIRHDLDLAEKEILKLWELARDNPDRERIASQFFLEQRNEVVQGRNLFMNGQQGGLLPKTWDHNKKNIVIFTSSEDEYVAIGEQWASPLYATQLDGLNKIFRSVPGDFRGIHFYHRMHPNLRGVENEYTERLTRLKRDFVTVIFPDDPVSTYALLDHADKVLTFGSTIGIEAVYWDKPSILAGKSYYRNLGGTYNPGSHQELMELLSSDLQPKEREPALMYGYYQKTFGTPFRLFRAQGVYEGEFRDRKVQPPRWEFSVRRFFERHPSLVPFANAVLRYRAQKSMGL